MSTFLDDLCILSFKLLRRVFSKRKRLASKYLRGSGLEIGALAYPLFIPPGASVTYLDKISREEAARTHPDQDSSKLVEVAIIDDGFTLASVQDASFDFLIANHVLEHTPNPVLALGNWSRVLRPGGILYLCLPFAAHTFDRGREITPPQHMLEDYQLILQNRSASFELSNRRHLVEWITISEPNILKKRDRQYVPPSTQVVQKRVAEEDISTTNELHFHTFSHPSLRDFLVLFTTQIDPSLEIREVVSNFTEGIAILRKKP
jgi:ubiquinone/menaquinone biosynthesis C-methylase UbiE